MTRAFLPLLQNNLRIMFGLSKDFKQRRKDMAIYIALGLLLLPIVGVACFFLYYLAQNTTMDMLASMISSIMFASEMMVLFFGVQSTISLLFFAKDNELLMALPVTGLDIFVSKMTTIYLLHLGLAMLIQLPVVLAMGIGAGIKSASYYIYGLLGSLLTPFIPLFIITIIAIPLGYIISYFKRNNIIGTILVLLLFGGFFAGYYYLIFAVQKAVQGGNFDLGQVQAAMQIMSYIIYPNTYIASSMVIDGIDAFKNFAIFFAIVAGLAVVSMLLSAVLYKGSARRGLESGSKKNSKIKDNKVQSVYESLLVRDVKSCLGETSSAINYLLGLIIPPIVMVMMGLIYGGDNQLGGTAPLNIVAVTLALIFSCGMNYFAIVAFSREGRQFDVLKMLPVKSNVVINQKIMLASIYTFVVNLILTASMFIAKIHYVVVIMIFVTSLFTGNAINIYLIYSDLKSPNFVWNTNKELFKNNSKSLTALVMTLPFVIVAIASIICFQNIFPNVVGNNELLLNFIAMTPVFLASVISFVVVLLVIYPKLSTTYEKMEF